jgi:hypothetical protein
MYEVCSENSAIIGTVIDSFHCNDSSSFIPNGTVSLSFTL